MKTILKAGHISPQPLCTSHLHTLERFSLTTISSRHHHIRSASVSTTSPRFIKQNNAQKYFKTIYQSKMFSLQQLSDCCRNRNLSTTTETTNNTNIDETLKPDDPQANLVWIDLEMTGLDINKDTILEIAVIVTDSDLNVVCEGPEIVINHPESVLTSMNEWSSKNHQMTGLVSAVRKSSISMEEAERMVIEAISPHITRGRSLLAGNSVHTDRKFLNKYMPTLIGILHHRIIDVTSIRELCKRWFNQELTKMPEKRSQHRALDDIKESIQELRYYKKAIFKPVGSNQSQ